MPPRRRFALLVLALLTALTVSISAVLASWPTTCVELNDLAEAAAGNDQNVGIYQRVFGDQAEAACRHDHWDDVRGTFAWAISESKPPAPAPATSFYLDPGLQPAWNLAGQVFPSLADFSNTTLWIQFGVLEPHVFSVFSNSAYSIIINENLRYERPEALAALIVHEVWHVIEASSNPRTFSQCIAEEVWATIFEAMTWRLLGPLTPSTSLEWSLQTSNDIAVNGQQGESDFDDDVSDWPDMVALVYARGYATSCAA